jgi:hypothetical protein
MRRTTILLSKHMINPATRNEADRDSGSVLLKLNLQNLPPEVRRDLEANAHLARTTPAGLIARLLNRRLEPAGIKLEAA